MASRYRNGNGMIVSSDDEDDVVRRHNPRKKNLILDSDSEYEAEEESDKLPFHSTVIGDHVLPNFEEMCVDNREKRISDIAEERSSLSANSVSEQDVFQSDGEIEQMTPVKPRKSRISLALGKLLNIESEAVSAACRKSLCSAKETLKNPSIAYGSDNEDSKLEKSVILFSSDSESEKDNLVKNGNKYLQNSHGKDYECKKKNLLVQKHDGTVVKFSSDDSEEEIESTVKNDHQKNVQSSKEVENTKNKIKEILVPRHEGTSSDDSDSERTPKNRDNNMKKLSNAEGSGHQKKIHVQEHDGTVVHFSSDEDESDSYVEEKVGGMVKDTRDSMQKMPSIEGSGHQKQKILLQEHDGTVVHFSSDEDESDSHVEKKVGGIVKDTHDSMQKMPSIEGSGHQKQKILHQEHDGTVVHFSSDEDLIDSSMELKGNQKENTQCTEQKGEVSELKQKQLIQSRDTSDIVCISEDSESDEGTEKSVPKEKLQPNINKNDCQKPAKENSGNNIKMNGKNDQSEIQVLKTENGLNKSKVSDIRSYIPVQKPQVIQSYSQVKSEIDVLTKDISKLKNIIKSIDINQLPDNGMKLQMKLQENIHLLKLKERELKKLPMDSTSERISENIDKPATSRLPIGFGVKALQTQIREKTLTEEALSDLHGSISTCPSENVLADAPLGLRSSVELMIHQRHALAWLLWRETQKPPAGILADDMGLGKTLTMISLVLKCKEKEEVEDEESEADRDEMEEESSGYPLGGTLVVCPASLLLQWEDEVKKHCKRGILEVEIHHGSGREENARKLAQNDIVITTYSIARTSANKGGKEETVKRSKRGVLHRVRWRRIILDEAHVVRNHKSQQSLAVCLLMGRKRWALTGTPIHNKELDLYALLKFLRVSPFDDYNVWRRWVDSKNTAGIKRLNTVINAIMLRRTKALLQDKGELASLPEKKLQEIFIELEKDEFEVYTKVLWFSKTLFAQFLQQRADKEMLGMPTFSQPQSRDTKDLIASNPELANMFSKMQQMTDIKTHDILVLLLRLRQICVHPGLIKAMLDEEAKESNGIDDANEIDGDILSRMGAMSLEERLPRNEAGEAMEADVLQVNNPVFDFTRMSSKMKAVFKVLNEKVINTSDKGIIVSQWTSMLNIIHNHLIDFGVKCDMLSGAVPVKDRMEVVKKFNSESGSQVLLLSLTAGGVGLNLTGGNHLFLIDLHWNPQLESQAFDRVYRVGQKKPVYIYKFICQETIEERIKILQDKKLSLADGVLSGTMQRNVHKLTLQDLKSLFSM